MKYSRIVCAILSVAACASLVVPASAASLEYRFDNMTSFYDGAFYQTTSNNPGMIDTLNDGNAPNTVIVTADGQVTSSGAGVAGDNNNGATLNSPEIPIGQFPDMWGEAIEQTIKAGNQMDGATDPYNLSLNMGLTSIPRQEDGSYGAISLGKLGIYAKVYEGATAASMQKGAGHVEGTSLWDGNVVLCGHNRGSWPYFAQVKNVQVGDVLTYRSTAGVRTYKVTFSGRISATDLSVLNGSAQNQLTLLTCVANVPSQRHCVIAVQNS